MSRRWWRRMQRLLGQSRIRLSVTDLRPPRLSPGDRLEIGGRVWWVVDRDLSADAGAAWALASGPDGGAEVRARLLEPSGSRAPIGEWILDLGGDRIPLCLGDLLHYPGRGAPAGR